MQQETFRGPGTGRGRAGHSWHLAHGNLQATQLPWVTWSHDRDRRHLKDPEETVPKEEAGKGSPAPTWAHMSPVFSIRGTLLPRGHVW